MTDAVTDTHALIWYLTDSPRLGDAAQDVFQQCDSGEVTIFIPTISLVEIVYLQERNRISKTLTEQLSTELNAGTSGLSVVDLTQSVVNTLAQIPKESVPDMPDRIIAATALSLGVPLMSRDRRMPFAGVELIW